MAIAKWSTTGSRSSNLASTFLNSLANTSESAAITYDNSSNRNLYGSALIKLGSINPSTGGSITLRATFNDGTDTPDSRTGGDQYVLPVSGSTSAKVVAANMIRLYPFSMRFSVINNTGVALSGSGNELYITPWNEDVT